MPDLGSRGIDAFIRHLPQHLMQVVLHQERTPRERHRERHRRVYKNVLVELRECFPVTLMDDYFVTSGGTWSFLFAGRSSGTYFPGYLILGAASVRRIAVSGESRWWTTIHACTSNDNKWFLTICHPSSRTRRIVGFEYPQFSAELPLVRIPDATFESLYSTPKNKISP